MPLHEGDIIIDRILGVQLSSTQGRMVRGLQYRFTVRGHGPFYVEVPEEKFDVNHTYQLIMRAAADQIDLLDKFSAPG